MSFWEFIVLIGLLKVIYSVLRWVYFNYISKIDIDLYKYGWIVITGASDGIGKSVSTELALRGFKLILVSRNKQKLENVAKEMTSMTSNPNIKIIVSDFSFSHRAPKEFYQNLINQLSAYEISGLINNVGTSYLSDFSELSLEKIEETVGVNIYPMTFLCHYLIPNFVERHKKTGQRSLIINYSSVVDLFPLPKLSVYTATKRYNDFFSEGIRSEYSDSIDVATVKPSVVNTNLAHRFKANQSPDTVYAPAHARYLLKNLHKGYNSGHWKHSITSLALTALPSQVMNYFKEKLFFIVEKHLHRIE